MTTRIKGPEGGSLDATGRSRMISRAPPSPQTGAPGSASSDSVESVHITGAAHQLLALQQQIGETPDIDVARVEQLRTDISQNHYRIDADRITDRLLQLEADLQASSKHTVGP